MRNEFEGKLPHPDLNDVQTVQALVAILITLHGGLAEIVRYGSVVTAEGLKGIAESTLRAVNELGKASPEVLQQYMRILESSGFNIEGCGVLPVGSMDIVENQPPVGAGATLSMSASGGR